MFLFAVHRVRYLDHAFDTMSRRGNQRGGATLMGDLNINSDVIDKCQNHVQENKMKRVYQRQQLKDQQKQAWQTLGERLELLTSESSNVITLQKRYKLFWHIL